MVQIQRTLRIVLPERQSAFLWGPRKTGKSTLLKAAFPRQPPVRPAANGLMLDLAKRPALLRERLLAADPSRLAGP